MQYGIQRVFKLRGYDLVTDEPKIVLNFLKDVTLTNGQEQAALTQNGTPMVHFDHSLSMMLEGSSSTIDDGLLSLQAGTDVEILTNTTEIRISEILEVASNSATVTYTPTGTAGAELKYIEILDAYGNKVNTFTQVAGVPATTEFSVSAKVITFFASDLTDGTKIRVHYFPTAASARKISQLGSAASATLRWECEASFKDVCTKEERMGYILIYSGHLTASFDWSLSEGGDPATHAFSVISEKTCYDKFWDIIFYDEADLT